MDGGMMTMQMPGPGPGMNRPRFFTVPRMQHAPPPSQHQGDQPARPYMSQVRQQLMANQGILFDGKRMRKAIHRKTVDYNSSVIKYLQNRIWQRDHRDARAVQPDPLYQIDLEPPCSMPHNPINCVTTKFVRTSTNKFRCPIFVLTWTPEGRRLVTGASSGEFTLWNGLAFNFETILQAHDTSVRAMRWSHNDLWMVTADHAGFIKYWQSNMNNVKMYQGHKEPVRGISFCPSDSKFATCSDDGTVRVWDFVRGHEERILRGHGADVKSVDWHPQKALLASGSKDNQQPVKLWDPRLGNSLATIHAHKHTVMELKWNKNGNWLLTASRDHLLKLFDIRNMKEELQTFKGHKKEATAVAWHPIHEGLFASGGSDGAIMFWMAGCDREVGSMEEAHEGMVWSLAWHPMGHILASGSNDHTTKFWTRNRPGDKMRDKYNLNNLPLGTEQELLEYDQEPQLMPSLPGMGLEHGLPDHLKPKESDDMLPSIPGLDFSGDQYLRHGQHDAPRKKVPYARPIPKSFEQAWTDNKQSGVLVPEDKNEDGRESHKKSNMNPRNGQAPSKNMDKGSGGGLPPGIQPGVPQMMQPSGNQGPRPRMGPPQMPQRFPNVPSHQFPSGQFNSQGGPPRQQGPGQGQPQNPFLSPGSNFPPHQQQMGHQQQRQMNSGPNQGGSRQDQFMGPPGSGGMRGPPQGIGNQQFGQQRQDDPHFLHQQQHMPQGGPQQGGRQQGGLQQGGRQQGGLQQGGPQQGGRQQGGPQQGMRGPPSRQGPMNQGSQFGQQNQRFPNGEGDTDHRGQWQRGRSESLGHQDNRDQDYRQMGSGQQAQQNFGQGNRGRMRQGGPPGPDRGGINSGPSDRGRFGPSDRGRPSQRGGYGSNYGSGKWEGDSDMRQQSPQQMGRPFHQSQGEGHSYGGSSQDRQLFMDRDERYDHASGEGDIDERFQRGLGRGMRGMPRGRGEGPPLARGRGHRYNGPAGPSHMGGLLETPHGDFGSHNQSGNRPSSNERGSSSYYGSSNQDSPQGQSRKRGWEEGPGDGGQGRGSRGMSVGNASGRPGQEDPRAPKYGRQSTSNWQDQNMDGSSAYHQNQEFSPGRGGYRGSPRGRGDFRGSFRGAHSDRGR